MKPKRFALTLLVVFLVLFAGWALYDKFGEFTPPAKNNIQNPPAEARLAEGQEGRSVRIPVPPRHPVAPPGTPVTAQQPQQVVLPFPAALDQADPYLRERLPQLIADRDLLVLLNLNYFIQKLVLFIDHLPEKSLPRLHLPITPPAPGFITLGRGTQQVIGRRNATRYTPYVKLVEAIPDAALLQLYRGLYPLFQQAYFELDPSNPYFNDRLIQVIDDLLQTPEPQEPIPVIHHVSRFKYADESLESRSAGQKILLRMGAENSRRVKEKLQSLRQKLTQMDW